MKPLNLLWTFLFIATYSCHNSYDKNAALKEDVKDIENDSTASSKSVFDIDSDFKTFINRFSKDSIFQIGRIDFPLRVWNIEENGEQEVIINKSDFKKLTFGDSTAANQEFDKYKEEIKINGSKAIIEIRWIDNGIFIDVYFEKKSGKWFLVTWKDSST